VYRYFSGRLLDADCFELEQQYLIGTRRESAIWLEVDEGNGFRPWHELTEAGCDPDGRCFVLDRQAGIVHFGDGGTGRRPSPGAELRGWYRSGSGTSGNTGGADAALPRSELVRLLAEVSHFTWMRQSARDRGIPYETLDPCPTPHEVERAEEVVAELERLRVLGRA